MPHGVVVGCGDEVIVFGLLQLLEFVGQCQFHDSTIVRDVWAGCPCIAWLPVFPDAVPLSVDAVALDGAGDATEGAGAGATLMPEGGCSSARNV